MNPAMMDRGGSEIVQCSGDYGECDHEGNDRANGGYVIGSYAARELKPSTIVLFSLLLVFDERCPSLDDKRN